MTETKTEPLAGRSAELAALAAMAGAASSADPQIAIIHGAAGMGKSSLVEHFVSRPATGTVLRAAGTRWETSVDGSVLAQLQRGYDGGSTAPSSVPADPAEAGQLLLARLRSACADAAAHGADTDHPPLVVWIDDVQWADEFSLRALVFALRRLDAERVLVLLAVRDEQWWQLPAGFREFAGSAAVQKLRLRPLVPEHVVSLAWSVRALEIPAPMALRLCAHAGGNPGYLLQLLQEQPDDYWNQWHEHLPAPLRLRDEVETALAGAGAATRALVQAAAVLESGCLLADAVALADAAGTDSIQDPLAALDEARALGLLKIGADLQVLNFPYPLLRAAVYASLTATERAALHRSASTMGDDEGEQLFHLAAAAALPDIGLARQLDAYAAHQAERGAWLSAAAALLRAGHVWPDATGRQQRLLQALDALVAAGDLPRASAYAQQVAGFRPGPLKEAVLGYLAVLRGRETEADMQLDKAWQQCNPASSPDIAAMICQRRVLHALAAQNGADLVLWAERAIELAPEDSPAFIESRSIMGLGLAGLGRIEEAHAQYGKFPSLKALGAQRQRVQLGRGWLLLAQDEHYLARDQLAAAVPTEYHLGSGRIAQWAQGWLARAEFELGDWDEALRTVERGLLQQERLQIQLARPLLHLTAAQIHALRGDADKGALHRDAARAPADSYAIMQLPAAMAAAFVAEAAADYEGVLRALGPLLQLDRANGMDEPGFWPWHDVYANALAMTDRMAEAADFLVPHEELAAKRGHRTVLARLAVPRGRILGAEGRLDEARAVFETSLAGIKDLPTPYVRARGNFAYGQMLRRAGQRREAADILARARDLYLALGASVYVERCDREIQASGLQSTGRRGALDFSVLTAQEIAVARLVAEGRTNKETGLELFIAAKTVQYHLTRIYSKLGISSRSELAARYRAETEEG